MSEIVKAIQQNTRTADGIWFIVQGGDENDRYRELAISQFDNCPCCDNLDSVGVVNSSYDDVMFSVRCYRCDLQIDGDTIAEAIERWNNAERPLATANATISALEGKLAAAERLLGESTIIEGKGWSISNNGNPAKLIALRQYDENDELLSYTHHDSALEAFEALQQENTND